MKSDTQTYTIVIVGAGFAGLSSLLTLLSSKLSLTIILIDKDEYFEYTPSLHFALTDKRYDQKIRFSLKKYYKKYFVHDEITQISENVMHGKSGARYEFDYAIVTTGSRTNYYGNESFEKFGFALRRFKDVLPVRERLKTAQQVTVVGGGYTGVEIAGLLASKTSKKIRLVHMVDRVLDRLAESVSQQTDAFLRAKNVEMVLGQGVDRVTQSDITLSSGEQLPSDLTIIATGMRPNIEPYAEKVELTGTLSAEDNQRVFFAGDVARSNKLPTAHNAMIEGREVGEYVVAAIKGEAFIPKKMRDWNILAIAFNTYDGVITIGSSKGFRLPFITGFGKWLVEKRVLFELKYKIRLPL